MRRRNGSVCTLVLACLALLFVFYFGHTVTVEGATRAERQEKATECVRAALISEASGSQEGRGSLLRTALEAVPNHEPARWLSGQVRHGRDWIAFDALPEKLEGDLRLLRYERARAKAANTVADQLSLADWCRRQGLDEQQRAHLTRVIELSPDHADAREQLGFVRVDGRWIAQSALEADKQVEQDREKNIKAWRRTVTKLAGRLEHPRQAFRDSAIADLMQIDSSAVAAIEELLFQGNEELALVGVDVLANIPTVEASTALARQAIVAERPKVRREAAKRLKTRNYSHFVPNLLDELQTELDVERQLFTTPSGRLIHRHVAVNENQGNKQAVVVETQYQRDRRAGGDSSETLSRTLENVARNDREREQQLSQRNAEIEETNERIMDALHWAVDVDFKEPAECWAWWDEHNEIYRPGSKQLASLVRSETVTVQDRTPILIGTPTDSPPVTSDCLAAGTPVWTSRGLKAIEKIELGDLVLSKNCETGELAYKPVLRTTVRPHSQWTQIRVGSDTISTSGGHLFWGTGNGWAKSRDLKSGQRLHTVAGSVDIEEVQQVGEGVTYNLVVADFNTYFVGEEKLLSHDNTVHTPTTVTVPGLKPQD